MSELPERLRHFTSSLKTCTSSLIAAFSACRQLPTCGAKLRNIFPIEMLTAVTSLLDKETDQVSQHVSERGLHDISCAVLGTKHSINMCLWQCLTIYPTQKLACSKFPLFLLGLGLYRSEKIFNCSSEKHNSHLG